MNDRPTCVVNLLTYLNSRRWKTDGKFVHFKGNGVKELSKEFLNKRLGTVGTKQIFLKSCKKLTQRKDEASALKAYRISHFFIL